MSYSKEKGAVFHVLSNATTINLALWWPDAGLVAQLCLTWFICSTEAYHFFIINLTPKKKMPSHNKDVKWQCRWVWSKVIKLWTITSFCPSVAFVKKNNNLDDYRLQTHTPLQHQYILHTSSFHTLRCHYDWLSNKSSLFTDLYYACTLMLV